MPDNQLYNRVLILGASSEMARPFVELLFKEWTSCTFILLARDINSLQALQQKGKASGHQVELHNYDLLSPPNIHFSLIECCVVFAGWLPPDNSEPEKTLLVNATAIQLFLDQLIAANLQSLKHIIITGSIAGSRIRPVNEAYGTAKAALHTYARSLQKKYKATFKTTLVIPGYVKTRMNSRYETPAAITLSPEQMAKKYYRWLYTRPVVVYSQPAWKLISLVLRSIPEFVIQKMKK